MNGKTCLYGLWLALAAAPLPAAATLGGDVASVAADAKQLEGTVQVVQGAGFAVHAIQLPSGTVVREYVSPSGSVFAISWQGPWLPDLKRIFGSSYFAQYSEAAQGEGGARAVKLPGLVVQSGGRMRAFMGRAYLPPLLPAGVSAADIK